MLKNVLPRVQECTPHYLQETCESDISCSPNMFLDYLAMIWSISGSLKGQVIFFYSLHADVYYCFNVIGKHSRKQDHHSQVDLNQYLVIFHNKTNIAKKGQTEISGYSECGSCGMAKKCGCWDYKGLEPRLTWVGDPDTSSDLDHECNRRGGGGVSHNLSIREV